MSMDNAYNNPGDKTMTDHEWNEYKIEGIREFITDAEEALTDPCVIANPSMGNSIRLSLAEGKRQLAALISR